MTYRRGEPPTVDAPTLASLGASDLTPEQLAALASYLRDLAEWFGELRFLELERRREAIERLSNRPALGYYMQLRGHVADVLVGVRRRSWSRLMVQLPDEGTFSTRAMLRLEARAIALYDDGREAGAGVVSEKVLAHTFADPRFDRLSDEQRAFVRELVTSGMRIQAGVGRAGSGKTTSMEAAVAAWRASGMRVVGVAVGGTQSVILGEEATGEGRTVASLLASYFDYGDRTVIDSKTVVLVDEASLLSIQDAASLEQAVTERGGILRVIGDQEQHSSVAAGGFFRFLVEQRSVDVPQLTTVYRQQGAAMAEVRLALDEYRDGMIHEALLRLERDGKITEAATVTEAYDLVTAAWYVERQRRVDDPARRLSSMTAERHHERLELNTRARAMLKADGTLAGPELVVDGIGFQVGDEVIARVGDHDLRAEGAARGDWVRNGALGVVREVGDDKLVVAFERWGSVEVSSDFIGQEIAPGLRGGIMHSYAMTTFAAQGATMAAAMPLVTDASSRAGVYVGITRPQFDLNAVVIRYDKVVPPVVEDDLPIVRSELRDLVSAANTLDRERAEQMATAVEPDALAVADLAANYTLAELDVPSPAKSTIWSRQPLGAGERSRTVGLRGVVDPADDVVVHLGARPEPAPERRRWDTAASEIATYRERSGVDIETLVEDGDIEWALGERPADPAMAERYDAAAGAIRASLGVTEPPEQEYEVPELGPEDLMVIDFG